MKFAITFKDPDGVSNAIDQLARESIPEGVLDDDIPDLEAKYRDRASEAISPWVDYCEYITIDFDTEAGTATVRRK